MAMTTFNFQTQAEVSKRIGVLISLVIQIQYVYLIKTTIYYKKAKRENAGGEFVGPILLF